MALVIVGSSESKLNKFFSSDDTTLVLKHREFTIMYRGYGVISAEYPSFIEPHVFAQLKSIALNACKLLREGGVNDISSVKPCMSLEDGNIKIELKAKINDNYLQIGNDDLVFSPKDFFTQDFINSVTKEISTYKSLNTTDIPQSKIAAEQHEVTAVMNMGKFYGIQVDDSETMPMTMGNLIDSSASASASQDIYDFIIRLTNGRAILFNTETFQYSTNNVNIDIIVDAGQPESEYIMPGDSTPAKYMVVHAYNEFPDSVYLIPSASDNIFSPATQSLVQDLNSKEDKLTRSTTPEGMAERQQEQNLSEKKEYTDFGDLAFNNSNVHNRPKTSAVKSSEDMRDISTWLSAQLENMQSTKDFVLYQMIKDVEAIPENEALFPLHYNIRGKYEVISENVSYTKQAVALTDILIKYNLTADIALKVGNKSEVALSPSSTVYTYSASNGFKKSDQLANEVLSSLTNVGKLKPVGMPKETAEEDTQARLEKLKKDKEKKLVDQAKRQLEKNNPKEIKPPTKRDMDKYIERI